MTATKLLRCLTVFLLILTLAAGQFAVADTIPQPTLSPDAPDYDEEHPELLVQEQLYAASAILIEADHGTVIFEKDADARRYPASTTKIMTVMLGITMIDPNDYDKDVIVSERAVDVPQDSSTMDLKAGQVLSYRDLLYGTMLLSANDGSNVIAETVSGSIEAFVQLMNDTAASLGCTGTHFANPHGYHDDNHYTTAHDMALIAQAAMQNELFRQIVGTYSWTIDKTNLSRKRNIVSTDQLLNPGTQESPNKYYYPSAIGIKTGQHSQAGYCFVGGAEQDGVTLISVVFYTGYRARWADTIKLMNYGFSQYMSVTPVDLYNMNPITIETSGYSLQDSNLGKLQLKCVPSEGANTSSAKIVATKDEIEAMASNLKKTVLIEYTRDFQAPIEAGQIMGTLTYFPEGEKEVVYNLVASRSIEKRANAPRTLAEIEADVEADPNPMPPITLEFLLIHVAFPLFILWMLVYLLIRLFRRRRKHGLHAPRVTHHHLK